MNDRVDIQKLKADKDRLIRELERAGAIIVDPSKNFRCPFHDDANPSSGIFQSKDGGWGFKCFSCNWSGTVIDVMAHNQKREAKDVLRDFGNGGGNAVSSLVTAPEQPEAHVEPPKPEKPAQVISGWAVPDGATAVYYYNRPDGKPFYRKLRFDPARKKKFFMFERYDTSSDAWIGGKGVMDGIDRTLYRCEQFPNYDIIYVVEGEKCADALWDHGMLATTNDDGAGKWCQRYSAMLRGKRVVIFPDNDEHGEKHGKLVADSLFGFASRINIIKIPGLAPKQDVYDWIMGGGDICRTT